MVSVDRPSDRRAQRHQHRRESAQLLADEIGRSITMADERPVEQARL